MCVCIVATIQVESFAGLPIDPYRCDSEPGRRSRVCPVRYSVVVVDNTTSAGNVQTGKMSARPPTQHPTLPFQTTRPVCLALAGWTTVQRPGPARLEGFPADTTGHCERRCWLFGPMCRYSTLARTIQAVSPLGCVGFPAVGAIVITESPAFTHNNIILT